MDLTNNLAFDSFPSWSPDGRHVAFESNRDGGYQIYVMNADGSHPTQLTTDATAEDGDPSWSPDGRKILFTVLVNGANQIFVMNSQTAPVKGNSRTTLSPMR